MMAYLDLKRLNIKVFRGILVAVLLKDKVFLPTVVRLVHVILAGALCQ